MLRLRNYLTDQIDNGIVTGDELYELLNETVEDGGLSENAEEKALNLLDAMTGWCAPECIIGTGNYGQVAHHSLY